MQVPSGPSAIYGEVWRAISRCHPRWESAGPLTLVPEPGRPEFWRAWRDAIFFPALIPAMETARSSAACGEFDAIAACARRLDGALDTEAAAKSRAAGALLLANFTPPSGERLLRRFAREVAEGKVPGHLAVVIAVRAAAFSLPPAVVSAIYAVLEIRGCEPGISPFALQRILEDCLERPPGNEEAALDAA